MKRNQKDKDVFVRCPIDDGGCGIITALTELEGDNHCPNCKKQLDPKRDEIDPYE